MSERVRKKERVKEPALGERKRSRNDLCIGMVKRHKSVTVNQRVQRGLSTSRTIDILDQV